MDFIETWVIDAILVVKKGKWQKKANLYFKAILVFN